MSYTIRVPLSVFLLLLSMRYIVECDDKVLSRQERFLIYPRANPNRIQFIAGFGIPVDDLVFEAMTTGYVFKSLFFLPYSAEQLRNKSSMLVNRPNPPIVQSRSMQSINNTEKESEENISAGCKKKSEEHFINSGKRTVNNLRWAIYKGLEVFANRIGLSGRACVLKSICEAAEVPFHYKNGVLAEITHVLLTPSSSTNGLTQYAENEYFQAESLGRSGANCEKMFNNCDKSLLDHLTNVHTLTEDLYKL